MKSELFVNKINQRIKDLTYLVIQIIFTFLVIYFLAKNLSLGWGKAKEAISEIKPLGLSLSVVLAMIAFFLQGLVWEKLVRFSEKKKLRGVSILHAFYSSLMLRYVPGNLWSYLTKINLHKKIGLRRAKVLYLSIIEIFINVTSSVILFFSSLLFWPDKTLIFKENKTVTILSAVLLVIVFALPWLWKLFFIYIAPKKHFQFKAGIIKSKIWILFSLYLVSWIFYGLSLFALIFSLVDKNPHIFIMIIGATTVAFTIGFLSFITPSGIGVRESVLTLILSSIITSGVAALFAIIFRLIVTIAEILIYLLIAVLNKTISLRQSNSLSTEQHEIRNK